VFEVDPDEIEVEFAAELDERRAVRGVEHAQGHASVVERGGQGIPEVGVLHVPCYDPPR
jgi:hypothetical protein